ncbi:AraC family transcriptional regulator [Cytophagaceae bacterium YF14B1]|uniref:AraC family transcriptional regulator n=1 Tax=Xanthocytophaga flava TaxID=3048013 RepID=A0AAE3QQB9_9BACT|nr:AraC family transcriptional regulator [Xanthocytophaga flavus]MDJ1481181.1 AraC family transcriptional regulator [Xanthocytophaga flavus]
MENKQEIIYENGRMTATRWDCDGIKMGHAISQFDTGVSHTASSPTDVVRLHFGLKGDYRFVYKQLNQSFDLIGSHHNIMYSKGFDIIVENKTPEIETFGVQFPKDLFIQYTQNANEPLKQFAEDILSEKNVILSHQWVPIDLPTQNVIQQIIHCPYTGDLQKLFLLSKSIELLVLSADAYQTLLQKKSTFIRSQIDKEKIIAVRDLLNERLQSPPNLSEIARMVGLNEYKLKRGFKEIFDTTVFGYLAEQRMQLAYTYLRDTEKTAAEVSVDLGFATPQYFNNAFKKRFGITPFFVRNNP